MEKGKGLMDTKGERGKSTPNDTFIQFKISQSLKKGGVS